METQFLYTDELNEKQTNAKEIIDVLQLAKKYEIPMLTKKCVQFLKENMHFGNACSVYQCGKNMKETDLELKILHFIERSVEIKN